MSDALVAAIAFTGLILLLNGLYALIEWFNRRNQNRRDGQ